MAKYRRRRRSAGDFLGPAHPAGCLCAWDHCGQDDARRAARRTRGTSWSQYDDARLRQLSRNLGLSSRSRRAA